MAKNPSRGARAAALEAVLPSEIKVIEIPAGASVLVDVDVNEMVIPYTVSVDGGVLIKSLVDRREPVVLGTGTHRIGWAFSHAAKDWMHKLTLKVGATATVLETRSEAKKDQDHSVGVAFLVVA